MTTTQTPTPYYSLSGPNNEYTYKKVLGVAYEYPGYSAATETVSSLPFIFNNQIMSSNVPSTAPTINTYYETSFSSGGFKYGTSDPNIFYYSQLGLPNSINNQGYAFVYSTTQSENLTTQSIPSTYDSITSTYAISVYSYSNQTYTLLASDGPNAWIFDTATGCLTFINQSFPGYPGSYPYISFYRYEGDFGVSSDTTDASGNTNLYGLVYQTLDGSNTAFGYQALATGDGSYNCAFGYQALSNNQATGTNNTAVGYTALFNNSGGSYNTAVGDSALLFNTSGIYNTAVGHYSQFYSGTGSFNTSLGTEALQGVNSITGSNNTGIDCA
jgi:hypothetical protein